MHTIARIRFALAGLVIVLGGATLVFHFSEGEDFFDSIYFTIITVTTVGYGDVTPKTPEGKITAIITIVSGFVLLGMLAGSLTEMLVEGQIRRILGRRKLEKDIEKLENHFIVCGFGRIGSIVCRELRQSGFPFVLIESSPAAIEKANAEGYLYLQGDATDDDLLTQARIHHARGLVAVLPTDADNVFITMSARDLNRKLLIVARGEDERTARKLARAGASRVVSPYEIGGIRMAHAILRPAVIDFLEAATRAGTEINMEEVRVKESSPYVGQTLKDSNIRQEYNLIVVAIRKPDGKMSFNPSHLTEIRANDVLITMGPEKDQQRLVAHCR